MSTGLRMTAKLTGYLSEPKAKHYRGMPPEFTAGKDLREQMPVPVLLEIEKEPDGIYLFRLTADGQVVGDTWHMTVKEAQEQARFEFPDLLSDWTLVPADVEDVVVFGLQNE